MKRLRSYLLPGLLLLPIGVVGILVIVDIVNSEIVNSENGKGKAEANKPVAMSETEKARWDFALRHIIHEDDLVTARMSAYLTLQGLLLTSIGLMAPAVLKDRRRDAEQNRDKGSLLGDDPVTISLFFFLFLTDGSIFGMLSSLECSRSLSLAYEHNKNIEYWFRGNNQKFPGLRATFQGSSIVSRDNFWRLVPENLPFHFSIVWAAICLISVFCLLWTKGWRPEWAKTLVSALSGNEVNAPTA